MRDSQISSNRTSMSCRYLLSCPSHTTHEINFWTSIVVDNHKATRISQKQQHITKYVLQFS